MYDVITLGTATRDVFLMSSLFKVLRDPEHLERLGFKTGEAECFAFGSKLEVDPPIFTVGGGAANAAVTFSRFGYKTASIVRLGRDMMGEEIIRELKEERVTPFVAYDAKLQTAYSAILLSRSGERTILTHRGASLKFQRRDVPLSKLQARWLYVVPGLIDLSLMFDIVRAARAKKTRVAMNLSGSYTRFGIEKLKPLLRVLDVVIVNREEASIVTKVSYNDERDMFRKFDYAVEGIAVITDGPRGSAVSDGRYYYRAGVFKEKKLIDRTGAGDAFGSGFVAGLMEKGDVAYALRVASANATAVVEAVGAQAGILTKKNVKSKRFQYLDLDVEPL